MSYLKRNTKYSILAFLVIVLSITISISTLAKTEVYFSLSDNPQKTIIKNINQAEAFINIAMYTFTDKEILLPLIEAQNRGVKIRVYLDRSQIESTYSVSRLLVQKGIKVRISTNNYIMHNKFAIIDKGVHSYIDKGFGLINIFYDDFLGIIREGEIDFGFGEGGNRYSYVKNND